MLSATSLVGHQGGSWSGAVTGLDAGELDVRELVRRRIDSVTDRAVVRRWVDEFVAAHDERTLTSTLPPFSEPTLIRCFPATNGPQMTNGRYQDR